MVLPRPPRSRVAIPLAVLVLVLSAPSVPAATLRVPEDYTTIYAAVDAAAAGDSVLVGPGTWTERDTRTVGFNGGVLLARAHAFLKPNLTIIGTAGADATVLLGDAPGAYSNTILIHPDHPSGPTVIQGLTLRGQTSGYYRAVLSSGSGPLEFYDCVIESCTQGLVLWAADLAPSRILWKREMA